ncbi:stage III sporulation protein AG [Salicibibacter cibarius]|uniref:Stage III sporulation protein AG n=1 Tax=Salicibibacter cibarius TaxID=2743000 RepID=A0A7T7CBI7_9BACI|nr:stage III sporulation protein AG [Salicibibacter cibarius]QQK75920.1 stage III sporulation protein AG [Salicibibacter cibarius]
MSEEKKPPFSKWFPPGDGSRKFRWYYLGGLLVVGILFMFIGTSGGDEEEQPGGSPSSSSGVNEEQEETGVPSNDTEGQQHPLGDIAELEHAYANQLEETLESMSGVSGVDIVVNLEASESKVYEKDTTSREQITDETDTEGGNRTLEEGTDEETLVLIQEGDSEQPLLIRTEKPDVTGVLVVAEGVEELDHKESVIEAVTRTLDVPAHRVSVLPKQ